MFNTFQFRKKKIGKDFLFILFNSLFNFINNFFQLLYYKYFHIINKRKYVIYFILNKVFK